MHPNKDAFFVSLRALKHNNFQSFFSAVGRVSICGKGRGGGGGKAETDRETERRRGKGPFTSLCPAVDTRGLLLSWGKVHVGFSSNFLKLWFLTGWAFAKKNHHKVFVGHLPVLVFCPSFSCIGYCWKRGRRNPYTLTSSFWYYRAYGGEGRAPIKTYLFACGGGY